MPPNHHGLDRSSTSSEINIKIMVLGEGSLGKTSLIERYITGKFPSSVIETAGVDSRSKTFNLKGRRLRLTLVDTSGRASWLATASHYLSACDGVVIAYDISNRRSFQFVETIVDLMANRLDKEINSIIVATKVDKKNHRKVTRQESLTLSKNLGIKHFDTSSLSGFNVEAAFSWIIKATAMRLAAESADISAVDALMNFKVPPAHEIRDGSKPSPTNRAAVIQATGDEGFTPLHYASLYGALPLLQVLLVHKGTDINAKDSLGRTALHIAVEKSKVPIVKALTKAGADLRARDSRGRTPMDLAEAQGHQEMVEALEQAEMAMLYNEAMATGTSFMKGLRVLVHGAPNSGKSTLIRSLRADGMQPVTASSWLFETHEVLFSDFLERSEQAMADMPLDSPSPRPHTIPMLPGADGHDHDEEITCRSFAWDLFKTLFNIERRQLPTSPFIPPPPLTTPAKTVMAMAITGGNPDKNAMTHASRTLWNEGPMMAAHVNDVTLQIVDLGGHDLAAPLRPLVQGNRTVHLVLFDLFKAAFGKEECVKEIQRTLISIESGTSSSSTTSKFPTSRRPKMQDIFLIGTFKDMLPAQDAKGHAKLMTDVNKAIVEGVQALDCFYRIHSPGGGFSQIFYAVTQLDGNEGVEDTPEDPSLTQLRHDVCEAIQRHEAIKRPRPAMWLRVLEELRALPAPQREGESFYKHAVALSQARYIGDMMSYEFTNRPMDDNMWQLMMDYLEDIGEVMRITLPATITEAGYQHDVSIIVKPAEDLLKIYKDVVRVAMADLEGPSGAMTRVPRELLYAISRRLRSTGTISRVDLAKCLPEWLGAYLDVMLGGLERMGLVVPVNAEGKSLPTLLFPAIPLFLHEDSLHPSPVDSPTAWAVLSGGKLLCYYTFRPALPPNVLGLLAIAAMKERREQQTVPGLCFKYRLLEDGVTLSKDRIDISLDGYILTILAEASTGRLACLVEVKGEDRYLSVYEEAHIGIILYELLQDIRRNEWCRFKLDLMVVDGGRSFDFVKDVLMLYKAQATNNHSTHLNSIGDVSVSRRSSGSDPLSNSGSTPPDAIGGVSPGRDTADLLYWAEVYTQLPSAGYKPLPSASTNQDPLHSPITRVTTPRTNPWKHALLGQLCLQQESETDTVYLTTSALYARKSLTSAYAVLCTSPDAVVWKVEMVKGGIFKLRVWGTPPGSEQMRGWYLALVSKAKDQRRQMLHVIVHSEEKRAANWEARWLEDKEASSLRLQWVDGSYRQLAKGEKANITEASHVIACAQEMKDPCYFRFTLSKDAYLDGSDMEVTVSTPEDDVRKLQSIFLAMSAASGDDQDDDSYPNSPVIVAGADQSPRVALRSNSIATDGGGGEDSGDEAVVVYA